MIVTVLALTLAAACWTDLRSRRIPNTLTYAAALALLVLAPWGVGLQPALLGGIAVGGILLLMSMATGGHVGMGDVKLGACVGLAMGPTWGLVGLLVALVAFSPALAWGLTTKRRWGGLGVGQGASGASPSILARRPSATESPSEAPAIAGLPFAPFLTIGAVVGMLGVIAVGTI